MIGARLRGTLLAAAVTAVVFLGLLALADLPALGRSLAGASPWPLIAGLALVPAIQWLRAWRFGLMMSGDPRLPGRGLIRIAALLNLFNFLLPFRVGEASFPILMKRHYGMDYAGSAGILILVRLMDACTVVALLSFAAAAAFQAPLGGWGRPALIATGAAGLLGLVLLPHIGGLMRHGLGRLLGRWPRLRAAAEGLVSGGASLGTAGRHLLLLAQTFGIWLLLAAIALLAVHAVDPGIGVAAALTAGASANLAFALPVTGIAGLGPAQAAWATALNLAGTGWDTAIATALAGHAIVLTGALVLGGLALITPAPGGDRAESR